MNRKYFYLLLLVATVLLNSGCYLEQGKLHFSEFNLNPITVYKMAPLERTIFCLSEVELPKNVSFEQQHARLLATVENDPEKADWSDLVCLALSSESSPEQIKKTIDALNLVLAVQPQGTNPVRGFKGLLEQRLELYGLIDEAGRELGVERLERFRQVQEYEAQIAQLEKRSKQQSENIKELEQKVQKLKEVELLLHPIK